MNGAELIAAERHRQEREEGWSPSHDDDHDDGELVDAAIAYAAAATGDADDVIELGLWPWHGEWWKPSPADPYRDLAKAGALIAAEIDRRQRANADNADVIPRPTPPKRLGDRDLLTTGGPAPELIEIGEDGQWLVAYGHLEPRLFVALAAAYLAAVSADDALEFVSATWRQNVTHVWAVERRSGPDPEAGDAPAGVGPGQLYVTWYGITSAEPDAFPLTILDREG